MRHLLLIVLIQSAAVLTAAIEGNTEVCASPQSKAGNRAVACGATNPDRPAYCCPGYKCGGEGSVTCREDTDYDAAKASLEVATNVKKDEEEKKNENETEKNKCASPKSAFGNRAIECGATNTDRPKKCCSGYVCEGGNGFKCVEGIAADTVTDTSIGIPFLPTTTTADDDQELCAGWRDKARECGDVDAKKNKCCPGYECSPEEGKITCVAARKEFEPLREADPFIQKKPIQINSKITIVGTNFAAEADSNVLKMDIPGEASDGDMLLLFIGGSAGSKRPEAPKGWELVKSEGKADLNIMSLYKWYDEGKDGTLRIAGGKNTFAIMSALQGVDRKKPLVDSAAVRESAPGKDGRAVAPSAFGVEKGVNIVAFAFDDPQRAQLLTDGYDILATTDTGRGDGMAAFASSTDATGYSEAVFVAGSPQSGGGNDVSMTVSLRPDGGPYDDPPPEAEISQTLEAEDEVPKTQKPTRAPTSLRPTAAPTEAPTKSPTLKKKKEPTSLPKSDVDEDEGEENDWGDGQSSAASINRFRTGMAGALLVFRLLPLII